MTFEEIKMKFEKCASVSIVSVKEIQYGKCISLSNGGMVNCFNSGKYSIQGKAQDEVKAIIEGTAMSTNRKIFVVYGHDETAKLQLEALLRRWDLTPIILDQQASAGQTIIEKLEEYSKDVGYAIVLATPDDEGKAKTESALKSRVRQNVVLELGMFLDEEYTGICDMSLEKNLYSSIHLLTCPTRHSLGIMPDSVFLYPSGTIP